MRRGLRQLSGTLKRSVAVFVLALLIVQVAPSLLASPTEVAENATAVATEEMPSVEELREQLEARLEALEDISAVITLQAFDRHSKALINGAEMELQAVAPSVMRLTYQKPDYLRGNVYVLDYHSDEVYVYSPLFDLAECSRLDAFVQGNPLVPTIEGIMSLPNGDNIGQIEVVDIETIDGTEYVVLKAEPSQRIIEEGLDDVIEGTLDSAMGLSVEVEFDDTMYIWVDRDNQLVRQIKVISAEGVTVGLVELTQLKIDQGLSTSTLKAFRGAEIRRCR